MPLGKVTTIPFSQPATPPVFAPAERSKLLEYMLSRPKTPDPLSPAEGFVDMLNTGLEGYLAGKTIRNESQQRRDNAQSMADMLLAGSPESSDQRDKLTSAILAGMAPGDAMKVLNIGQEHWDPYGTGQQRNRSTGEIKGTGLPAVAQRKPYSNFGEVLADFESGYIDEATKDRALDALFEGDGTALDQKINTLVEAGMPLEQAQRLAAGAIRVSRNPVTDAITVLDLVSGEVIWPPQEEKVPTPAPVAPVSEKNNLDLYGKAREVTGPVPAIKELATDVVPLALDLLPKSVSDFLKGAPIVGGFFRTFPDTVEKRQELVSAQNDLVRSLSINPRFPVGEINRIRKEINISPTLLRSPEGLQSRMRGVDTYLRNRLENELAAANDETLPKEQRQDALNAATSIGNFLVMLNVPQSDAQSLQPGRIEIDDLTGRKMRFKGGDPSQESSWEFVD